MVPVIVVCTIFIDVSRIRLAQGLADSSADLALNSVLTQYDTELADYYGLMASCQDIEEFYDVAENYFEFCMVSQGISVLDAQKWAASLMDAVVGKSDINDLIQIDTENTEATIEPTENADLANPVMMKSEIIEFMKYRAPVELIGEFDTQNGFVSRLTSVQDKIEIIPHETRIQKEKVEYYEAENELLKEALTIYELLKEYENMKYDGTHYLDDTYMEQIKKDIRSDSDEDKGLEETYQELHKKYVMYWANTEEHTSPVVNDNSYEYTKRSLPYVEDASNYHQYEVVGDFTKIKEYVDNCTDTKLKAQIEDTVVKYYEGDYGKLISYKEDAAAVDGWGDGGAVQYEFSLTVEQLEGLGLLKEIKNK